MRRTCVPRPCSFNGAGRPSRAHPPGSRRRKVRRSRPNKGRCGASGGGPCHPCRVKDRTCLFLCFCQTNAWRWISSLRCLFSTDVARRNPATASSTVTVWMMHDSREKIQLFLGFWGAQGASQFLACVGNPKGCKKVAGGRSHAKTSGHRDKDLRTLQGCQNAPGRLAPFQGACRMIA